MADLITDPKELYTALASVTDKTGLLDFMRRVTAIQETQGKTMLILSSTWTFKELESGGNGVPVTEVSKHTGFPEMMDGRLKTLHPLVHGGFLWRLDNPQDLADMAKHGITPIDMAVVNLYDFDGTVAKYEKGEKTFADVIENIDIGWPSMLRSAAKWAKSVIVDPADYADVLGDMDANKWRLTAKLKAKLQAKVFTQTASYDTKIGKFLGEHQAELTEYFEALDARILATKAK